MSDLIFQLGDDVAAEFPLVWAAGFLAEGLDIAAAQLTHVSEHTRAAQGSLQESGLTLQNVADDPRIAGWRVAVARCGLKPGTFKSSVEQLARRFLKGESISTTLPVVNLYCAISAGRLAPLGGYDRDHVPGTTVILRMGQPTTDRFSPLGGRTEDMPIRATIPVYAAESEVLCWAFNHRDSRETCLSAKTTSAMFFSEAVTLEQRDGAQQALLELSRILEQNGAKTGAVRSVDTGNRHVKLEL